MEGWDAIQIDIYRKEDPSGQGITKSSEREKKGNRERKRSLYNREVCT